jgi:hypothetical protein
MDVRRIWPKGWRAIVLLLVGSVMGANLIAPAVAHVAGWNHNWTTHIKPRTDARYVPLVVRPGQTIRGTIGARYNVPSADEVAADANLQAAARVGLDDAHVQVAGVDGDATECPGSATAPTAAPGFVCMYPYFTTNATVNGGYMWGGGDGGKWGFQVSWDADAAGGTVFFANWAYRAPLATAAPAAPAAQDGPPSAGGEGSE